MKALDFEYDGITLSSFGYMLCSFDSKGVETVSNGSEISFNTVPALNGMRHDLTSCQYEDCITATMQICKHPCFFDETDISLSDVRDVMQWLNRKGFHKLKLVGDIEYSNIFFEASFNVSKIEFDGRIKGFELEMFTNRPFALQETVVQTIECLNADDAKTVISKSDEQGYIYPDMKITVSQDGNLEIHNDREDRIMRIANCKAGEVIDIEYPMIKTSLASHKIQNDFNWRFFRIANEFKNKMNKITVSLPCVIELRYNPIVKVGV